MVLVSSGNANIFSNVQPNTIIQNFAPPTNYVGAAGQFWIDRSVSPPKVYQYDTVEWVVIESSPTGVLPVSEGGTGDSTLTAHNVLIGEGTSPVAFAAPSATSGVPLVSAGAAADPVFGTAVVAGGGTGAVTLTAHGVLLGEGTSAVTAVPPNAATGLPLISQGAAADPVYGTASVPGGGTGAATLTGIVTGNGTSAMTANAVTQHGVLIGGASNAASSLGVAATGTVLAGVTGADPAFTGSPSVSGSLTAATTITATLGNITATNGNLVLGTAGNKLVSTSVASTTTAGANSFGTVTLVGGTATISTTAVTASSIIMLTRQSPGSTGANPLGMLSVGTITASTSFVINSLTTADSTTLVATDVSVVGWMIIN